MATRRSTAAWTLAFALGMRAVGATAASVTDYIKPASIFVQSGIGDQQTNAYLTGLTWDWPWRRRWHGLLFTGYIEAAGGRWSANQRELSGSAWSTQVDATPVLRIQHDEHSRWFVEFGVGANYILPIYQTDHKRFSTKFNFGDHAAVGVRWGDDAREQLSLRVEHFSNAGIEHPNPGENFVQLRFAHALR